MVQSPYARSCETSGHGADVATGGARALIAPIRGLMLAAALLAALGLAGRDAWQAIMDGRLPDTDDITRLLQIEQWFRTGDWWTVGTDRIAPLDQHAWHWSRLADLPVALIAWPLQLVLPLREALLVASFVMPPMLGLAFALLVASTAGAIASRHSHEARFPAAVLGFCCAILSVAAMDYFTPGRVDHHGLQLILVVLTVNSVLSQDLRGGLLAGVAMAASLRIGLETAPVLIPLALIIGADWIIRGEPVLQRTRGFAAGLLAGIAGCQLATVPPAEWIVIAPDALSLVHIAPLATAAVGLLMATWAPGARLRAVRSLAAGLAGLATLGALAWFDISLLVNPFGAVSPVMRTLWLNHISESTPLWTHARHGALGEAIASGVGPALATTIGWVMAWRCMRRTEDRAQAPAWIVLAALLGCVTPLLWLWEYRVAGQAAALAAITAASASAIIWRRSGRGSALIVGVLATPVIWGLLGAGVGTLAAPAPSTGAASGPRLAGEACIGVKAHQALRDLPPGLALTTPDQGPTLALSTHLTALAGPYHRHVLSMGTTLELFLAPPEAAHARLRQLGVTTIVICQGAPDAGHIIAAAPHGLMAALASGAPPPAWLKPIDAGSPTGLRAWRIVD